MKIKWVAASVSSLAWLFCFACYDVEAQTLPYFAAQPGPYEIHHYLHRVPSFERAPYYANHPPVYYGYQPIYRQYGWTPYPYPGLPYRAPQLKKPAMVNRRTPPADSPAGMRAERFGRLLRTR